MSWLKPKVARIMAFIWRSTLALAVLACLGLLGYVWLGGAKDTADAMTYGRRLIVPLDGSAIQGKQVEAIDEPAAQKKPDESKPTEPPKLEKPAASETAPAAASAEKKTLETTPETAIKKTNPDPEPEIAEVIPDKPEPPTELPPVKLSSNPIAELNTNLTEKAAEGLLPIIGRDGSKPWQHYAKSFSRVGNQPVIAIIVSGLGQNKQLTAKALTLPENITVSFSPYAKDAASWGASARASGHEALIDLPLEPSNYPTTDPGPHGLLVGHPSDEVMGHLQWAMSRLPVYIGFLTPQNEGFTEHDEGFKFLLSALAKRGLLLVLGKEPAKVETRQILEGSNTASEIADILIDEDPTPSAIAARLSALEQLAKKRGYAVGIAQPYPVSVEQLRIWTELLADRGITLVPVSFIVKMHYS